MEIDVFGQKATGLIVHNPKLEKGQVQGINNNIDKTRKNYVLYEKLMKRASGEISRGRKPTVESVKQSVETVLKDEYMKDIFQYEILDKDSNILLNF
jgi:hypothetical protein